MANRFWVGGSGTWDNISLLNWSLTSGGVGGALAPTTADTVFFDANSGTAATVTVAATATGGAVTVNKSDINLVLSGDPTFTGLWTLTSGSMDLANNALTVLTFNSNNANVRTIAFGTGRINLTGNAATVLSWQGSNLTVSGSKDIYGTYAGGTGTRTFTISGTGALETNVPNIYVTAGTDTVVGFARVRTLDFTGFEGTLNAAVTKQIFGSLIFDPGMTLTNVTQTQGFSGTTGPFFIKTAGLTMSFPILFNTIAIGGMWEFEDALTMAASKQFRMNAGTVKFKAGTTNTGDEFVFLGASTRQVTIGSTTPGTQYTLSQASGTVTAQFTTISDSNATGGATWNSYVNQGNIDAGNNDGWDFGLSPDVGGAEYTYSLRSFTQPRRF